VRHALTGETSGAALQASAGIEDPSADIQQPAENEKLSDHIE
jgi:hypothetical protein